MTPYYNPFSEELEKKILELEQAKERIGYCWEYLFDVTDNMKEWFISKNLSAFDNEMLKDSKDSIRSSTREYCKIATEIQNLLNLR